MHRLQLSWQLSWERISLQCSRPQFDFWAGNIPWRRDKYPLQYSWASWVAQTVKNLPALQETRVRPWRWEDLLEEGIATCSSIPAWRSSWTKVPGRLQSTGLQRVGHGWATKHSICITSSRRKSNMRERGWGAPCRDKKNVYRLGEWWISVKERWEISENDEWEKAPEFSKISVVNRRW